jgi:hypothetical protein
MLKKARFIFIFSAVVFISCFSSRAYFSDQSVVSNFNFEADHWVQQTEVSPTPVGNPSLTLSPTSSPSATASHTPTQDCQIVSGSILINEIMANPLRDDNAIKPDGEWIELYNKLECEIDLNNWYLRESSGKNLPIIAANTVNSTTKIAPKGLMVVYRNGINFPLNNDFDTVTLYWPQSSGSDGVMDNFSYGSTTENKTWSRVPDGGDWAIDRYPTIGNSNGNV